MIDTTGWSLVKPKTIDNLWQELEDLLPSSRATLDEANKYLAESNEGLLASEAFLKECKHNTEKHRLQSIKNNKSNETFQEILDRARNQLYGVDGMREFLDKRMH